MTTRSPVAACRRRDAPTTGPERSTAYDARMTDTVSRVRDPRRIPFAAHAAVMAALVPEIVEVAIFDTAGEPRWSSADMIPPEDHALAMAALGRTDAEATDEPGYEPRGDRLAAALELRNDRRRRCGVVIVTLEISADRSLGPEPLERTLWPALVCLAHAIGEPRHIPPPGLKIPSKAEAAIPAQIAKT